jgi:O-antigen ligase
MSAINWKAWTVALPPAALLFILPFPGTVALRLLLLSIAFVTAILTWKRRAAPPLPFKIVLALWAIIAAASVPGSFDPAYSLGEVKNEIGYTLMAFFAFYVLADSTAQVRRMGAGLAVGMVVMVAGSLTMQSGQSLWVVRSTERIWNEASFIGGSGVYATYLMTAAPVLLAALLGTKRFVAGALAFVAILIAGYFTGQKIFILVAALQLAVLLWLLNRGGLLRLNRKWIIASMVVGVVLLGSMMQQILVSRAMTNNPLRDNFIGDVRVRQWPKIAAHIMEHPLTGAGFGRNAMQKAAPELLTPDVPLFWHAHNVFLNYGLSMGLPGVLALLLVFGCLLRAFWKLARYGNDVQRVIGAAGVAMVAGIVARNLTNDFFMRDMSLLFWSLSGMLLGLGNRLARNEERTRA